ncbi:TPA: DUF3488 domain-containing protein [Legionella pneumophila]|uniref:DUF3488 and transglutaminase-like domain-containing protein n=1 Tax=Legionella pneumophila TaxID=446 RepID=UPI000D071A4D|nr:DUF3488 and transglutaminase-like domain-containing protein [Legionella pneumophila]HAT1820286.1 DUF3488 domain-containing transglutaminase family protein [Legionella pneumophila]HAT1922786.1 DUF3488 domain-containing transglutaminase family protein [Legionella pneumophila]HAT7768958.1 DUF3488 domain-containing protein [Legionella pneumophila]HAU1716915.1 DUF3488 domain-containing protein [Legionella pneumophila]
MDFTAKQHTLLITTRYALLVMLICYFPHFLTAPWWIVILILASISYKLITDYFAYPPLDKRIRFIVIISCFFLLKFQYGSIVSSGFFIGFLLAFIGLKTIEIHNVRDIKILILCNFYLIFAALIVVQELLIIPYLLIAILANLTLLLKLNAPQASLRQVSGHSMKLLLVATPLTVFLFYFFPRIANPLWQVPSLGKSHTGFSEWMEPGSVANLLNDDRTALRVIFKRKAILNGYWRGLTLSIYNGISWNPAWNVSSTFPPLQELATSDTGDYEVIIEPHQKKWLFYLGYPIASYPQLLFSLNFGLVSQNKNIITQRFAYALRISSSPYSPLTQKDWILNTRLPNHLNPRMTLWAKQQFAKVNYDPKAFIEFIQNYIKEESYWYTLTPPKLENQNDQMDYFWFDSRKGFCEHYASAVTVILRSVGIPARVIVGYQGGEWNPLARYLTIKQYDAHAWLEYWQKESGWKQLDPTSFISPSRIEPSILAMQAARAKQQLVIDPSRLTWLQKLKLYMESTRFFIERWLLFYNQDTQYELLEKIGLRHWNAVNLLQIVIISLVLFIIFLGACYQWRQKRILDPLLHEYHLLQKEFCRFNIPTQPPTTLNQQCKILVNKIPNLEETITTFLYHYEKLRLQHRLGKEKENKKQTILLFKNLRRILKQIIA